MQRLLGQLAGCLAVIAFIPYIVSILRGRTRPSRVSYGIWSLVGVEIAASYIVAGARNTMWIPVAYATLSTLVFALSITRGMGGASVLDRACLVGASGGALLWWVTRDAEAALYVSIAVEMVGFAPTVRKAWRQPSTESAAAWVIAAAAACVNLFAVDTLAPRVFVYPVYNCVFCGWVAVLLVRGRISSQGVRAAPRGTAGETG